MKVVILAGGKGTRMGKITENIPKPMIPVMGKPLLEYQVDLCARYGFTDIIILVNHLKQPIIDHFGDGKKWHVNITYFEEPMPLGTVGGIKEIEDQLTKDFLVLYGDVMLEMDLHRLVEFHRHHKSEATLVVHPNDHPFDSDLVELNDNARITNVFPKPHPENFSYHNMVNAAVYIFSPLVLKFLKKGEKADFGKDIFPFLYREIDMFGYNTPEYIKDMGTPRRLEEVEKALQSGKINRRSLKNRQRAIFLDRDGVVNKDAGLIHRPEDLQLYDHTIAAIKKINNSDFISVLVTNQSVIARNLTSIDGLHEIHKKLETELGAEGAKLDAIYYCPHHPDKGYPEENPEYKIECDCRKPKPGMLLQAAKKFHLDLERSFMVGDNERDTLAGWAAGCAVLGVMTGEGHKKSRHMPDYLFKDLEEAVDFILKDEYHSHLMEIWQKLSEKENLPFIIGIGGNSRSGKSVLSSYLQKNLEAKNLSVFRINLDDWILPKEQREEGNVLKTYQLEKMEKDLKQILKGKSVILEQYQPHPLQKKNEKRYHYKEEVVVIVEGVVALAAESLRKYYDLSYFKKVDPSLQKQRFTDFYLWKGLKPNEIDKLWHIRKPEYELIAGTDKWADIVI